MRVAVVSNRAPPSIEWTKRAQMVVVACARVRKEPPEPPLRARRDVTRARRRSRARRRPRARDHFARGLPGLEQHPRRGAHRVRGRARAEGAARRGQRRRRGRRRQWRRRGEQREAVDREDLAARAREARRAAAARPLRQPSRQARRVRSKERDTTARWLATAGVTSPPGRVSVAPPARHSVTNET